MTDALHFNIKFTDLTLEKQEEIIKGMTPKIQQSAEQEGLKFLAQEWYEPKPTTWQEAYCRVYALSYESWKDEVDAGKIVTPAFMWETWQEQHVAEVARQKATQAFSATEIEVTL